MATTLITGTSTGIGLATALAFGRAGHTVFATMRNPTRAPKLGEIVAAEGLPVQILTLDVDSDTSAADALAEIQRQNGQIDVLVNNAGVERKGAVEELSFDDFRAVMETNYFGALRCIKPLLAPMRQRRSGCIINVSSVSGKIACAPLAPYTASKFALEALSESLAQEMKPFNVRVCIVEPGVMDTPMARRVEEQPEGVSHYPQTRRFSALFDAALDNPVDPAVAADKILEIVDSGTWTLRHPVGPDAQPFLDWRAGMDDQQWVDWGALDDDGWYDRVQQDFGLDARAKV